MKTELLIIYLALIIPVYYFAKWGLIKGNEVPEWNWDGEFRAFILSIIWPLSIFFIIAHTDWDGYFTGKPPKPL